MQSCEQLLVESIQCYQEIGQSYDTILSTSLNDGNADQIAQHTDNIDVVSKKVQKIDDQLQTALPPAEQQTDEIKQLIVLRKKQITALLQQNNQIAKKAGNIATLLKHEFSALAKNNSAIAQYNQPVQSKRRSMLNNSY